MSHLHSIPPDAILKNTNLGNSVLAARELTVRPDSKGRIALGTLAKGISSFRVEQQADGKLILEPFKEIPAREAWLFENPVALAGVKKGLADAAAGKIRKRGSFSSYVADDVD